MKRMEKVGKWERKILENLVLVGSASVVIFCDQMASFLKINKRSQFQWQTKRAFNSLEKKGLVTKPAMGGKYQLTGTGQLVVKEQELKKIKLKPLNNWDRKWRVVIFDIPEELRPARNRFRRKLNELGFEMIQKSVFRSRLPCAPEIRAAAEILGISKFVQIITGDFEEGGGKII